MRPVHVAVPLAALAAVATRLPDPWLAVPAALAAVGWFACTLLAPRRRILHLVGPAAALVLVALPVSREPLLAVPGVLVGLLVGVAVLTALPPHQAGLPPRTGLAVWSPVIFVAAVLLLPLLLPALLGPERMSLLADRLAPAHVAVFVLLAAVVTFAAMFLRREVPS